MNKIKVSVIVPVYNVEDYIEECIASILNQTLKEIEIIIVNDGTKDNSMKKLEKYLLDSRIKVVNKENGGLSSARNAGLRIAKGEYIAFIDSDDFIELTMLEDLYNNSEDSEVVFSDIILYDNITKKVEKFKKDLSFEKIVNKGNYLFVETSTAVWNKIYKRSYLEKFNFSFIDKIINEDDEFSIKALFLAKKVKHIKKYHYYYRINREKSIVNSINSNKDEKYNLFFINSMEKIIESIKKFSKKYEKNFNSFEKILLKLYEIEQQIILLERVKNTLKKKEIEKLEDILDNEWNFLTIKEKYILKENLRKILLKKEIIGNVSIFDSFYYKNKIFTLKILRRIFKEKIKIILENIKFDIFNKVEKIKKDSFY